MPAFPWEGLVTAIWEWEIFIISAMEEFIPLLAKVSSHPQDKHCFSTPHQRIEASLINPKMSSPNHYQRQGILRASWTGFKVGQMQTGQMNSGQKAIEGAAVEEEGGA